MKPEDRVELDRIQRIIETQGWTTVSIDTRGDFLQVIIQKPKPGIERGK